MGTYNTGTPNPDKRDFPVYAYTLETRRMFDAVYSGPPVDTHSGPGAFDSGHQT